MDLVTIACIDCWVLFGCETWSLTLREEDRLRVFENRVLKRIFGPKRDEVTGDWKKLHKDTPPPQVSPPCRGGGACATLTRTAMPAVV
jgi:hypothetical protein